MSVTYKLYKDPRQFRDLSFPFLLRNEAAHCLGLGVVHSLIHRPELHVHYQLAAFFNEAADDLLGVAWVSAPHALGVSQMPEACLSALLQFAARLPYKPSGISAPFPLAESFAEEWKMQTQCSVTHRFAQCIYELTSLRKPPPLPGALRLAKAKDFDLLCQWSWNFVIDCGMAEGPDHGHGKIYARQAIHDRSRYVWEEAGKVVAMAGVQGHTPEGIRISWVYTPPGLRGRGYASQLVAAVCEEQMKQGKKRCFLYTDLENPTSNRIYQKIGFVPVDRPLHYSFAYAG